MLPGDAANLVWGPDDNTLLGNGGSSHKHVKNMEKQDSDSAKTCRTLS